MATPELQRMQRTLPEVLQDIAGNLQDIIRSEFTLARTEFKEQAAKTVRPIITMGVALVVGLYGIGFLLLAAVYGLSRVIGDWQAALLVGGVCAVLGMIFLSSSKSKLKRLNLKAEKTVQSLEENVQWAKHPTK